MHCSIPLFATMVGLSTTTFACVAPPPPLPAASVASTPTPPPPAAVPVTPPTLAREAASGRPPHRERMFRLDFVVTSADGGASTFSLGVAERRRAEIMVGKNVPLSAAPPSGSAPLPPAPRQDVGLKISAEVAPDGDDVVVHVNVESSSFDPPSSIRKLVASADILAVPGKATPAIKLDDDHKHFEITVLTTPLP
jgi:hypothetical protein